MLVGSTCSFYNQLINELISASWNSLPLLLVARFCFGTLGFRSRLWSCPRSWIFPHGAKSASCVRRIQNDLRKMPRVFAVNAQRSRILRSTLEGSTRESISCRETPSILPPTEWSHGPIYGMV